MHARTCVCVSRRVWVGVSGREGWGGEGGGMRGFVPPGEGVEIGEKRDAEFPHVEPFLVLSTPRRAEPLYGSFRFLVQKEV